jgi:hypothetical protein
MAAEKYALRRRAAKYEKLVQQFEQVRAELLNQRKTATESEIVTINERLRVNDRTLVSVREELRFTREHIERIEVSATEGGRTDAAGTLAGHPPNFRAGSTRQHQ